MIDPRSLLLAFIASAIGVVALTPVAMTLARRFRLYDIPNGRKIHSAPVPLLGGLAVLGATFVVLLSAGALLRLPFDTPRVGFLVGALVVFLLGLIDDRRGLSVFTKLLGQFLAAAFLVLSGNTDGLVGHSMVALVLCMVWTVGMMNAVNFLDGLDGLAAGTTLLAGLSFGVVGFLSGQPYSALVAASVAGAALGFLRWNWNPARVFLGDAGSLLLGYYLAALGLLSTAGKPSLAHLLVPVIVLGVPIFDITFVVAIRLREGRPISQPGKDHTLHRIFGVLRSVPRAVLVFLAASLVLGAAAVVLASLAIPALLVAGAGLCMAAFVLLGSGLSKVPTDSAGKAVAVDGAGSRRGGAPRTLPPADAAPVPTRSLRRGAAALSMGAEETAGEGVLPLRQAGRAR